MDDTETIEIPTAPPEKPKRIRKTKPAGVKLPELDAAFVATMTELGFPLDARHQRAKALSLCDDTEKAREFLTKSGVDAEPLTADEARAQAEVIIREQLKMPQITGDETMTKAKKAVKKAAKKKAAPKVKKKAAPKVKKPKAAKVAAPKVKAAKKANGTVEHYGIGAQILKMVEYKNGSTTKEILAKCVELFKGRDPAKMHNTVRGELQLLPKRLKRKMKTWKEDGRQGTIYKLQD